MHRDLIEEVNVSLAVTFISSLTWHNEIRMKFSVCLQTLIKLKLMLQLIS